jgi:hypothetical protein
MILFFAYQGWGTVTLLLLVGLLLLRGQASPRLEWLYALIAGSTALGAVVLGWAFVFRPPTRTDRQV